MNNSLCTLMDAFFIAILTWCAYTDIRTRIVSNMSIILLLCLGIAHVLLMASIVGGWWTYPAGIVSVVPFFFAWMRNGMGAGDVKLIMGIGLYLGLLNLIIAFALMVPALAVLMTRSWIKTKTINGAIPLAPVLAFGAIGAVALRYLYATLQF